MSMKASEIDDPSRVSVAITDLFITFDKKYRDKFKMHDYTCTNISLPSARILLKSYLRALKAIGGKNSGLIFFEYDVDNIDKHCEKYNIQYIDKKHEMYKIGQVIMYHGIEYTDIISIDLEYL